MAKRLRSDSGDSIPELEEILQNDSEDEDVEVSSRPKARPSEAMEKTWDNDDDSESEDDYAVEHSLMDSRNAARIEPFRISSSDREGITLDDDNDSREPVPERSEAWLEASENDQFDNERAAKQAAIRESYWKSVEGGSTGPERPVESYLYSVVKILLPRETPRMAMDRFLGVRNTGSSKASQKITIKARRSVKETTADSDVVVKDMGSFEKLTEDCDALVAQGLHSVLDESKESLQQKLSQLKFEYRWKEKQDSETHGPFSFEQLMTWQSQGCFAAHPIEVRYAQSSQRWREFIS